MPLPYHLIDGYNLLHAAGLARATYGPGDLERARVGLLVLLADGLSDDDRERTTVVFDAADPPPGAERRLRFRNMTVLFAVESAGDADAMIEELIRKHPAPRQLRVVSDDRRLQQAAKRRGAQAVKGDAFLRRITRRDEPESRRGAVTEAPAEGADWAAFFGLSSDELVKPLERTPPPEPRPVPQEPAPSAQKKGTAVPTSGRKVPADGGRRDRPPADAPPEPAAEDAAFWQRRIDELLRGGGPG